MSEEDEDGGRGTLLFGCAAAGVAFATVVASTYGAVLRESSRSSTCRVTNFPSGVLLGSQLLMFLGAALLCLPRVRRKRITDTTGLRLAGVAALLALPTAISSVHGYAERFDGFASECAGPIVQMIAHWTQIGVLGVDLAVLTWFRLRLPAPRT